MDEHLSRSLDEVRGIVAARVFLDDALDAAVRVCIESGVDRSMLAHMLGVERSTLYRRYVWRDASRHLQSSAGAQEKNSPTAD